MVNKSDMMEDSRRSLQVQLDSHKTQHERNKLGQFATPTQLARDVIAYGLSLLPTNKAVRFFDPAIGTGSFYSALRTTCQQPVTWARGFEIDAHYGRPAQKFWRGTPLEITLGDFTRQTLPATDTDKANLLICNPPYVRHHHLNGDEKQRLRKAALSASHVEISGLAGLYCYFIALAHRWMSEGGIAAWLVPSEFMDVNYGKALKRYLLSDVTLLRIHRFNPNDVQFDDALVSSAVIWFERRNPSPEHRVIFSYGGSMQKPALIKSVSVNDLKRTEKWTRLPEQDVEDDYQGYRLGDLFTIKRGIATGDNSFFILKEDRAHDLDIPPRFLRPILPSSRYIKEDEIKADIQGVPLLDKRLFLLDCDMPEDELQRNYPALWNYLLTGLEHVASRYLCRSRRYWYLQERRPAAPIVCTYIGRSDHDGSPFRFLLNRSIATATNAYLMLYPSQLLANQIYLDANVLPALWQGMNAIPREVLLGHGRVYGGGMHKLEPKELANIPANGLAAVAGL